MEDSLKVKELDINQLNKSILNENEQFHKLNN